MVRPVWAALAAIALAAMGCAPRGADWIARVASAAGAGWESVDPATFVVPGTAIAAWRGPDGATLTVYRSLPIPDADPRALAEELAHRFEKLPGVEVRAWESVTLADFGPAARVEALGPGTGGAWVASGTTPRGATPPGATTPTYRILLGVPRPSETLWIAWHAPESARTAILERAAALVDRAPR